MATHPVTTATWRVVGDTGLDCLKFTHEPVPAIGDDQVLVKGKYEGFMLRTVQR